MTEENLQELETFRAAYETLSQNIHLEPREEETIVIREYPEDQGDDEIARDDEEIAALIGDENQELLTHTCTTVTKDKLVLPSPDFIDKVYTSSSRNMRRPKNTTSRQWKFGSANIALSLAARLR